MVKSILAYIIGFIAGVTLIVSITQDNLVFGIGFVSITFILCLIIAAKIHKFMKSRFEKRRRGIYDEHL